MDSNNDEGVQYVDSEDVEEVIEIDGDEDIADDIDDMQLENDEDVMNDEEDEDEEYLNRLITPPRDDAFVVFKGHKDEVFSVDISKNKLVATGGKDDTCLVWSASSGEGLFECSGHKESVACVSFSQDGSLLATGDLNGLINVWKVPSGELVWSFEISEVQWLRWHHKASLLLAGSADGDVWLWNVPHGQTKTLPGHGVPCTSGQFLPDGMRVCVGYDDGTVKIWNLKGSACLFSFSSSSDYHKLTVTSVACHHDNNIVVTGALDGSVLVINASSGQVISTYVVPNENSAEEDSRDGVESLAFSKPNNAFSYLAIGCSSGKIVIWDVTSASPRFQNLGHQECIVKLLWHPSKPHLLLSSSYDGTVTAWDSRNGQQLSSFHGHTKSIFDFCITSDGEEIATVSADHTARVYRTNL